MDSKELNKYFLTGSFFILGIFLIIFMVFTLGKDRGLTESKFSITVLFKNVGGLSQGAPVRLSGVNVGSVSDIDFLNQPVEGRRVKVEISILGKYRKQLKNNIHFAIKTQGILGDKLVQIYITDGHKTVDLSKPIIGEDSVDVQDLAPVFAGAAESFTKTANELSKINMVELAEVMQDSSKALLETSRGINEIMGELQDISLKFKRLFDRLEQKVIEGDLFKVF